LLSKSVEGGAVIGSVQLAAALLLIGAGLAKMRSPGQAADMLRHAWWRPLRGRTSRVLVRGGGGIELAVGVAAMVSGSRLAAALLGGCYLGFTIIAARLLRGGRRTSCGCFGATDSPVGAGHLGVNVLAVGVAVAAIVRPPGALGGVFHHGVLIGVVGAGQAVLLAYLAFLSITALPALVAARRRLLEAA
jgi:hypothetical protein